MYRFTQTALVLLLANFSAAAEAPDTVFLEELTWIEVRDAIDRGTKSIIVPTAGTEQNGPHVVLGKHKFRMNAGAERIAREVGQMLVAPVVTFVPEGDISPPTSHMRYAGTISIPEAVYRGILEYTARSLRAHGFTNILFVGDSGGNQQGMQDVAKQLNEEWRQDEARVLFVSAWYNSTSFEDWLREQGYEDSVIGRHAGLSDTASLLAVAPEHVRTELMANGRSADVDGVDGDPSDATIELGRTGMDFLVADAVRQVRELLQAEKP